MSAEYYIPGPQRAPRVRLLFDRIAPRYDFINDLQSFGLHRFWKKQLISLANPRPGGTGDLALALAQAGVHVTGCDFSGPMLRIAENRASKAPPAVRRAYFLQADALAIPARDAAFDLVTIGYGNVLWRRIYFTYLRAIVPFYGLVLCRDSAAYSYILESLLHYPAQDGVAQLLQEHGCVVEVHNFVGGVMSIHNAIKPASLRERDDVPLVARDIVR
jgi:demethylmenaquinone methyltransferase/2-methoxy-6-polyprenyl-1,4-benzoquinol methylase